MTLFSKQRHFIFMKLITAQLLLLLNMSLVVTSLAFQPSIIGKKENRYLVTVPSSMGDYRDVGSLLVDVFDEQTSNDMEGQRKKNEMMWNLMGRSMAIRDMTNQYMDKARKMAGKAVKYELLLVKKTDDSRDVVGMAELGVSSIPTSSSSEMDSSEMQQRAVTIGVLAVSPNLRKQGIGKALVQICEEIASSWGETAVYAAVEPRNVVAMSMFESCGYKGVLENKKGEKDENSNEIIMTIPVRERMQTEMRPHRVLCKNIISNTANATADELEKDDDSAVVPSAISSEQ